MVRLGVHRRSREYQRVYQSRIQRSFWFPFGLRLYLLLHHRIRENNPRDRQHNRLPRSQLPHLRCGLLHAHNNTELRKLPLLRRRRKVWCLAGRGFCHLRQPHEFVDLPRFLRSPQRPFIQGIRLRDSCDGSSHRSRTILVVFLSLHRDLQEDHLHCSGD